MRQGLRRTIRGAALLPLTGLLLAGAGTAVADDGGQQEAGTSFRTATVIAQDETATAMASTGDYLYWTFPAGAGQTATAEATVTLPDAAARSGPVTWQLDVYDGLRRRQACTEGQQTVTAAETTASIDLSCTLRPVKPWSEPWADDPLPGAYYLRLTVVELPERDLGLGVSAQVSVTATESGGARASGGELSEPLIPAARAGSIVDLEADPDAEEDGDDTATGVQPVAVAEPESGWMGSWWTDRWVWTAAGGVLGAIAGVAGYVLIRPRQRES
ncbi:hypothetical protein N0X72_05680 [Streptomyces carpaticus]|uniref:Peptidase n=2 Tax=Streptomyces TaxID=1883 RepID=A0A1I6RYM2_9ACTN|nr:MULTISPECIES: hypothetical protein [Streptomyces]QKV68240.1 hypothetical protein HUT13_05205 [Streptomyces harbinensis]UWM48550.1 hypothetical protein N0X72_05680 [Streptomyces carpaticus]SFS69690.1 hypothetical protein SAMN05444716_103594 [Streptomyces harbinensis]